MSEQKEAKQEAPKANESKAPERKPSPEKRTTATVIVEAKASEPKKGAVVAKTNVKCGNVLWKKGAVVTKEEAAAHLLEIGLAERR